MTCHLECEFLNKSGFQLSGQFSILYFPYGWVLILPFHLWLSVWMNFTLNSDPSPELMSTTAVIATVLVSILGGVALMIVLCLIVGVVVMCTKRMQSKQGGLSG